jgi:hypothetical protein
MFNISLLQWCTALAVLFAWFYYNMTKDYGVWEKKGLFSVKPTFLFGNNKNMIMGKMNLIAFHRWLYDLHKDHG